MTLDAGGTEAGVVRFEEYDTDNIVADVAFALKLLWVMFLVGQQRGHMEHDLNVPPVRINGE